MISEGFDPSTGCPELGSFDVTFKAGSEAEMLGPHVPGPGTYRPGRTENWKDDTLLYLPEDLGEIDRDTALAAALYGGRIKWFGVGADGESWTVKGKSLLSWLGSGDNGGGIGPIGGAVDYPVGSEFTGSFADYLLALLVYGETNGLTLDATAPNITTAAPMFGPAAGAALSKWDTVLSRINKLVIALGIEYHCRPDGTVLFQDGEDPDEIAYYLTPRVVFGEGIPTTDENGMTSWSSKVRPVFDYTNEAEVSAYTSADGTAATGIGTTLGRTGKDFGGVDDAVLGKFYGASDELVVNGIGPVGTRDLIRQDTVAIDVDLGGALLRQSLKPGDWVYVISERAGLFDTENVLHYGGRTWCPVLVRCTGLRYPVQKGGVYVLHNSTGYGGANSVQRVTDYVEWETGRTDVTLGTLPPKNIRRAVLGPQWRPSWEQNR